jgi:hypothetical protein
VLADLPDAGITGMAGEVPFHMLAVAADGSHAAVSTTSTSRYAYWDPSLTEPQVREREHVR